MQNKNNNINQWVNEMMDLHSKEQFPEVTSQFSDTLINSLKAESELQKEVHFNTKFYLKAATILAIVSLNIFTLIQVFQNNDKIAVNEKQSDRELLITQLESEYFISETNIWESHE